MKLDIVLLQIHEQILQSVGLQSSTYRMFGDFQLKRTIPFTYVVSPTLRATDRTLHQDQKYLLDVILRDLQIDHKRNIPSLFGSLHIDALASVSTCCFFSTM